MLFTVSTCVFNGLTQLRAPPRTHSQASPEQGFHQSMSGILSTFAVATHSMGFCTEKRLNFLGIVELKLDSRFI